MSAVNTALEQRLRELVRHCCRMDVMAFKPGNVSVHSAGHGMTAEDFFRSADCVAEVIADPGLRVGERVLRSIEATQTAVACNTNLGIVLLCAPLVQAVLSGAAAPNLRASLQAVLADLDLVDAQYVFQAIRCAKPAGLGRRRTHDVHAEPHGSLAEIMRLAAPEDRIAHQYAYEFEDIFALGLPTLRSFGERWRAHEDAEVWAMVACYLAFLSTFPDTHIVRKFGPRAADQVRISAKRVETKLKACENPTDAVLAIQAFDEKLKREGFNPGTSADLAVGSLLLIHLEDLFADVHTSRAVSSPEAAFSTCAGRGSLKQ